jgi:hypothetical protein
MRFRRGAFVPRHQPCSSSTYSLMIQKYAVAGYKVCLSIQKARNQEGGMSGAYNASFAKFLAVNTHGMSDKSESDSKLNITVKTTAEIDEESN